MPMKKIGLFLVCSFMLSGCVSQRYIQWSNADTPKEKFDFLLKDGIDNPVKLDEGGLGLLSQERQTYLAEINSREESDDFVKGITEMCFPETLGDESSSVTCAYKYYSNAIDIIKRDNEKKIAEKNAAIEEERQCQANPECAKKEAIDQEGRKVNEAYHFFRARYFMNSDEYDYATRKLCDGAIMAQNRGAPIEVVIGALAETAGGDMIDRRYMGELVKACWKLGKYGITSSSQIIKPVNY